MTKKNGFTLVELLAVIVVLGLILLIAVPQVMNVINDSKKGVLASSARLIANSAENIKLSNDTMGINTQLQCSDVSKISANDYEDCTIEFVNGEALVTIIGKGKYEGLSVCKATSEDAEVVEGNCSTGSGNSSGGSAESGGGSVESTDPKCFAYEDVLDDTLGVQGISITGYSLSCPKDVIIPSEIDDKPVIAIKDYAFTDGGDTPNPIKNDLLYGTYEVSTLEGKFYNTHITQLGGEREYFGIGITSVIIPNSVTTIGNYAFYCNQLTSVTIPNSVTSIGNYAFYYNKLTSVTIPNSVTTIGESAFESNQLTSVTIPDSVTTIGIWAFGSNQLTSVTISSSVTSIGNGAFNNNKLSDEDAYIYKRNSDGSIDNTYVVSYGGISKDIVLPGNIITIGSGAFRENQLTSVTIPNSVTTIETQAFYINQLTNATIGNGVTTIGSSAFESNNLPDVTIGNSVVTIEYNAFQYNSLTSVTIPNSVTTIGTGAFQYNSLTSVTIGNSVTTIGSSAFSSNQLTSVTIPDSVTTIGSYAFYKSSSSNPNLTSIINTTGRSFNWRKIITGGSETTSITGTYNDVNVTTE